MGRKFPNNGIEERLDFVGSLMVKMTPINEALPEYEKWTKKKYREEYSRSQYYED